MERLSAEDEFMLWPDAKWPQDLGALAILDGAALLEPDGSLRIQAVRHLVAGRLHLVPRFRQLLYVPPRRLGGPLWVDAPAFDIADHIQVMNIPAPGDEAELLWATEQIRQRRLDRSRPLWEMWFLTGPPNDRIGLFLRMHHAIADGMAALATIATFLDPAPDRAPTPQLPWSPSPMPTETELLDDARRRRRHQHMERRAKITHPGDTARQLRHSWPALRELVAERPPPTTSLDQLVGPERRLHLHRVQLDPIRIAARAHRATVNDVLLTAAAGGVRRLLSGRGEPVVGVAVRIYVPVSLHLDPRTPARGNLIADMVVPLPIGVANPVTRLELISAETAARKTRARPSLGALPTRGIAGRAMLALVKHQHVNLTSTNIPGPQTPLYLAGARMLEVFPMVQLIGTVTLAVGAMSYNDQINIMTVADADTYPDLDTFAAGLSDDLQMLSATHLA
jgi:diacylglycerol O-acyltransferase / wax synthase